MTAVPDDASATTDPPVGAEPQETLALTRAQAGLWYAQQRQPESPAFTIGQYLDVTGRVDPDLYRRAATRIVGEVDALRTRFVEDPDDGPVQVISADVPWEFTALDLSGDPDPDAAARAWMDRDLARPSDPETGPLLSVAVIATGGERTICYQRVHHLVADGYGAALLLARVGSIYAAFADGTEPPEYPFRPLRELVEDDLAYQDSRAATADREFWARRLGDRPAPSALGGRPVSLPDRLHRSSREIPTDIVADLRERARGAGVSASSMTVAAVAAYVSRFTGDEDVVLGLPVTARRGKTAKQVPGMVSNIVPLRLAVRPGTRPEELAADVSSELRRAVSHQRTRPEDIRHDLEMGPDDRISGPTVNILPPLGGLNLAGMPARLHNLSVGPVDDLSIVVSDPGDGTLQIDVDGHPGLYTADELGGHLDRLVRLLTDLARGDERAVGALDVATDADRATVTDFGSGPASAPLAVTVQDLFEAQVLRSPDATALVSGDFRLSFDDLDRLTNRAARELRSHDVAPGRTVAVVLPRSGDLVISLLAIVKAGGAYLPVDPAYPDERIAGMLADARPNCVITDRATAARLPAGSPVLVVDDREQLGRLAEWDSHAVPRTAGPTDPAYVIYTSGSTGRPKGVVVEHRSLANLFAHHVAEVFAPAVAGVGGRRLRVAHISAVSFDASWDPMLWMLDGHELHFVDETTRRDPEALVAHLGAVGADSVETTPSYAVQLVEAGLFEAGVSVLCLGGEAVGDALWHRLTAAPGVLAFNFFGPAESTVDTVVARIGRHERPVIGRPVGNTRAYVLDNGLAPRGVGATGELYLAGEGLARGYLYQPERTAERFVPDPYGPPGSRMYRTGDLARWRTDGTLEFAGRTDDQVKVRGFRVELGEIDAVLAEHPTVRASATVVRSVDAADVATGALVTYVVAAPGDGIDADQLHGYAAAALPEHMVPSVFVPMEALPLTVNGKLDQSTLPAPEDAGLVAGRSGGRAARTPAEELLTGMFAQALGLPSVGPEDDFFALGGHSLLATRLISRIRSTFDVEIPIRALFEAPTVAGIAARLSGAEGARPQLRFRERPERLPLSAAQRRLWFLDQLDTTSAAYNIPVILRLRGDLDVAALRAALGDVVARHETLRTVFPAPDGDPVQRVLDPDAAEVAAPLELPVEPTAEEELPARLAALAGRGFDVTADPPLRAALLAVDARDHVLVMVLHHISADGWSLQPLAHDLTAAYTARVEGGPERAGHTLPDLSVQYADYTLWQRELLGDETDPASTASVQLGYWREQLAEMPEELTLPTDRARPARSTDAGDAVPVTLPEPVRARLAERSGEHGASTFMLLQAAFAGLLSRLGAGTDVPIGVPVAGRTDEALDELVGFFVNTLVLRTDLSGDPTFDELVARVRRTALDAYAHQDVPFERIVEAVSPPRSLSRHPLFQVMLSYQNTPTVDLALPGLEVAIEPASRAVGSKFDLNLDLSESADGVTGTLSYDADLFDRGTVEAIARRFVRFVEAVSADPHARISEIDLLDDGERVRLDALSDGGPAAATGTVLDRFAAQVRDTPAATAVVDRDGATTTFAELDGRARGLAADLVARGATGGPVAVTLPRSPDSVAALLGVLLAGATYVPVDPAQPAARLATILDEARPGCAVTDPRDPVTLPDGVDPVHIGAAPDAPAGDLPEVHPGDAAYVLYTSGSTGRPKGVVVEHAALANLVARHERDWFAPAAARAGRRLRVAHTTAVSFDASFDPVAWMLTGHELHMIDDEVRRDPDALVNHVRSARIDVLETTPSHVAALLDAGLLDAGSPDTAPFDTAPSDAAPSDAGRHRPGVLALGGEAVGPALWERLRAAPGVEAVNLYGPTEATVDALTADLAAHERPVIGRPVAGVRAHVLDERLAPMPVGSFGELHLAGAGLARGYLRQPSPTAQRFVADPYGEPGSRLYRTGDLARWNADGVLEFGGRADDQVKVRGFRIELGEVEAALLAHSGVAQAAPVVLDGGAALAAYLVPAPGATLDVRAVRSRAADRLPDYMIPSAMTVVDALPRTAHGKLDRAALPPIAPAGAGTPPRTGPERRIAALFCEVLGVARVGVEDSFFDLGGHSLVATRLLARIRDELGIELPIRALFEAPTVAALAARGEGTGRDEGPGAFGELLTLRATGTRPPLFAVHPAFGLAWSYAALLPHLPTDQPVYGLQARGFADGATLPSTVEEMIDGYAAAVRSVAPHGPYRLLGFSLGGGLAHRLAARLQAEGEQVEALVVLDSLPPDARTDPERTGGADGQDEALAFEVYLADQGAAVTDADRPLDAARVLAVLDRSGHPLAGMDEQMLRRVLSIFQHDAGLVSGVPAARVDVDVDFVTALRTTPAATGEPPVHRRWEPLVTGAVRDHPVDIEHGRLLSPEAIGEVGPIVAAALAPHDDDPGNGAGDTGTDIGAGDTDENHAQELT